MNGIHSQNRRLSSYSQIGSWDGIRISKIVYLLYMPLIYLILNFNFVVLASAEPLEDLSSYQVPNRIHRPPQPTKKPGQLVLFTINHKKTQLTKQSKPPNTISQSRQKCLLINAGQSLYPDSLQSSISLLELGMNKVLVFSNKYDKSAHYFIEKYFPSSDYSVELKTLQIDANYKFITTNTQYCDILVYMQSNFKIQTVMKIMTESSIIQQYSVGFSTVVYHGRELMKLQDLTTENLQNIPPIKLCQYLFIFDPKFLKIITPLNFAFYNRYTLDEMIIYPILAVVQNSQNFKPIPQIQYSISNPIIQNNQFQLVQASGPKKDQICFLSFPNDPTQLNINNAKEYLNNLFDAQDLNTTVLVLYAPYTFNQTNRKTILPIAQALLKTQLFYNVRLRIRANKTVTSLGVYESAHTFCNLDSMLVISRQNVFIDSNFISDASRFFRRRAQYYLPRFIDSNKKLQYFRVRPRKAQKFRATMTYYRPLLMHLQIIRAQFFKMLYLWVLRNQQLDFYETEASFIFPLLEIGNLKIERIRKKLFHVKEREMTDLQNQQIENIKSYFIWPKSYSMIPLPLHYNSLSNRALKRNAPAIIPKKIHQIWLGGNQLSQFRIALIDTLKKHNPSFEYCLWKNQNITLERFPYTYSLMKRITELEELQQRSLLAMVADVLRLQILYRFGGIYLDIKVEGLKSLDGFLKYEIFFNDMDYTQNGYGDPRFVGNTFMGSIPNSYYLNMILTQIITDQVVNPYSVHLPRMTGAYQLRKAFTLEELLTVPGYGFQLFSQFPDNDRPLKCSSPTQYYADQQIFQIHSHINDGTYKIGIPCRQYKQAYLVLYKELGRTWLRPKTKQIAT